MNVTRIHKKMFTTIYTHRQSRGMLTTEVSQAVPDQSYSIKELVRRYKVGTAPPVQRQGYYDDDPSFEHIMPDLQAMDIAEIHELATTNYNTINNLKNKQNEQLKQLFEQRQQQQQRNEPQQD